MLGRRWTHVTRMAMIKMMRVIMRVMRVIISTTRCTTRGSKRMGTTTRRSSIAVFGRVRVGRWWGDRVWNIRGMKVAIHATDIVLHSHSYRRRWERSSTCARRMMRVRM